MQIEYIEYVFLYKLYLNAYICIFVSASICIRACFSRRCRPEENLWSQLEGRRQEDGDTAPGPPRLAAPCPLPALRMRQSQRHNAASSEGRQPRPRPIRELGEGCSGQGCGVARRQQRPRAPPPPLTPCHPPETVLRSRPPLNSRGQRSPAARGHRPFRGLRATAPLPAAPRAIRQLQS